MKSFGAAMAVLASALLIFISTLGVHGQPQGDQTRGAAAPAQRPRPVLQVQPLLDPDGRVRDDAFVPGPALAAADRVYADIDGRRMKNVVNDVVAISRRSRDDGNRLWGRIAGTKYE